MSAPPPSPARRLDDFKPDARFAWCVTGSGHMLEESIELARQLPAVDLFLSAAGEEVLPLYGWGLPKLREHFRELPAADDANCPRCLGAARRQAVQDDLRQRDVRHGLSSSAQIRLRRGDRFAQSPQIGKPVLGKIARDARSRREKI